MARLVIATIEDTPTTFELQDVSLGRWLDVVAGGRMVLPPARGTNVTLPRVHGEWVPPDGYRDDPLPVRLHGTLWGIGATAALRRASWASMMTTLVHDILGNVGNVVRLTAYPPNEGLAPGETATIDVQVLRTVDVTPRGWEEQEIDIGLQCVSDPPRWTVE